MYEKDPYHVNDLIHGAVSMSALGLAIHGGAEAGLAVN